MKEYEQVELPNGIRVIHKQVADSKIAHVGVMLDIGSRDELKDEQGLAHFWEHMVFKGTKKRKAFHIINRLESLGGELNAYTTKEKICFYSAILYNHLDKSVELLADITFNSIFPEKQIVKERSVILEEMAMYRDSPEDAIQDDFDELIFPSHALGKNILGTEKTVSSFKRSHFQAFLQQNLNTEKIIISSVGNYPASKLIKLVKKHFGEVAQKNNTPERNWFDGYSPTRKEFKKPISQAHFAMGKPAFSIKDKKRIPFFFLINLLGGPGMNSKLNLSLREKHGLVYGVEASFSPYLDTGQLGIYFATDVKQLKKSQRLLLKEIELLKKKPLGALQLHKAKQQINGQLAMSEENKNSFMLMMAKSILDLNKVPNISTMFKRINDLTASELQELAIETLDTDQMSSLTYLPK
ncbi:MAG: insulinase family protein [Cytophagales bacterium]|nr:insulinase family protein [Cytophagales bacterium]